MHDIMLFVQGSFRYTRKADVTSGSVELPNRSEMQPSYPGASTFWPEHIVFTVEQYSIKGHAYLVGFSGEKPSQEKVEWAFFHEDVKPSPISQ